jgi:hypothetical protein
VIRHTCGGAHGVLVTAVSPPAFAQAIGMVGRKDLAEAVQFAAEGKVRTQIHKARLEDINAIFADLKAGKVDGRIVLDVVCSADSPNVALPAGPDQAPLGRIGPTRLRHCLSKDGHGYGGLGAWMLEDNRNQPTVANTLVLMRHL